MGNIPQIRNYAPNMIQKRKESASLVKGCNSAIARIKNNKENFCILRNTH